MRFTFGPPPDSLSADELASGEWQPIRQPPFWVLQLLSVPVGAVVSLLLFVVWVVLTPNFKPDFDDVMPGVWVGLATLLLGVLLQGAVHQPAGSFGRSVIGFWAARLTLYTGTAHKVDRHRYLLTLALPFVLLALGPLLLSEATRVRSGWLIYVSCVAAFGFGLNVLFALWAARQLPANALVAGIGFKFYWRVPAP